MKHAHPDSSASEHVKPFDVVLYKHKLGMSGAFAAYWARVLLHVLQERETSPRLAPKASYGVEAATGQQTAAAVCSSSFACR